MVNELAKTSSIIGALLVFCGILKMIFYYSAFNISIVDFLSFSEILTSFLDDINILLIFVFLMFLPTVMTINTVSKYAEVSEDEAFDGLLYVLYPWRYRIALAFALVGFILFVLAKVDCIRYRYLVVYVIVFSVTQAISYITMSKSKSGEVEISNLSYFVNVSITIIVALFLLARHDEELVKDGNKSVTIVTQATSYICNSTTGNIYIGKTESSVFVYDKSKESTLVVPTSEVSSYSFK